MSSGSVAPSDATTSDQYGLAPDRLVVAQLRRRAALHDAPGLQQIAPVGDGQLDLGAFFVRTDRLQDEDSIEYRGGIENDANLLTLNDNDIEIDTRNWSFDSGYTHDAWGGENKIRVGYAAFDDEQYEFEDETEYLRDSLGQLLATRQIRKMISSYVGENKEFERQYLGGELELEFNPQGTLAERLRAGGAGIPAFFTATGYGTIVADGKETREIDGRHYVLETALRADVSLVKAWKADKAGNLVFRKTSRNFNPACAMAGKVCVAEVEQIVEPGEIPPDQVHTPGIFVKRIFQGANYVKPIEQRTVRPRPSSAV